MIRSIIEVYRKIGASNVLLDVANSPYNLPTYANEVPALENKNQSSNFRAYVTSEKPELLQSTTCGAKYYKTQMSFGLVSTGNESQKDLDTIEQVIDNTSQKIEEVFNMQLDNGITILNSQNISDWQPGKIADGSKVYVIEWICNYKK